MSKNLIILLIVVFMGIGVAALIHRPIRWGMVLYGFGAAILNVGVLIMK